MKTLSFTLSDEAYEILKKTAKLKEKTVDEYIYDSFKWYEIPKNNKEWIERHLKQVKESQQRKKAGEQYQKHPLQEFILGYFPKTDISRKTIAWRTCPVQPNQGSHREHDPDAFCNHIGEYWYQIRKYKKSSFADVFKEFDTTKTYYFKSLKALKRNINKVMGYDHYKVK